MEFRLVQKIVHKQTGREFDLGYMSDFTFVETMDLSGPKVIMRFKDPHLYLQDNLKIKAEDEISITLADIFSSDQMDAVIDFTILSCPGAGDDVLINGMASAVYATKKPVNRANLFPVGSAEGILGHYFSGIKQDLTKLPVTEGYHILAGERPSYALRQMAREQAGQIFFSRDRISIKRISELMKNEPDFTYHSGDNREELQVITYQVKKPEQTLKDRMVRSYSSFSITDGWVSSNKNLGGVPQLYGSSLGPVLDSLNAVPFPVIDCTVSGNGGIRAGSVIGFQWHTRRQDSPLNEALPEKVVVHLVAHHYNQTGYFCRIKGVIEL